RCLCTLTAPAPFPLALWLALWRSASCGYLPAVHYTGRALLVASFVACYRVVAPAQRRLPTRPGPSLAVLSAGPVLSGEQLPLVLQAFLLPSQHGLSVSRSWYATG